jgi:endonuclease/exonuclease/phosphatase family metal-dependent hydrolase
LAEFIKEADADIIGLQEVDKIIKRTGYEDQLKVLAEKAGYQYYEFSPVTIWQTNRPSAEGTTLTEGLYGHGILSRYPIVESEIIWPEAQNPNAGAGKEFRNILRCEIEVDGKILAVYNSHLDFDQGRYQYKEVQDNYIVNDRYAVFIGDMNEKITELEGAKCIDYNVVKALTPNNQIDNILVSKKTVRGMPIFANGATSLEVEAEDNLISDHDLIYSVIEF